MTIVGIHFLKPLFLLAIFVFPAVYFLSLYFQKRREKRLELFARRPLWEKIIPELDWTANRRKFFFWCLSSLFFALALARPQWGEREETVKSRGLDVMLVLDVSKSMDTEDVVPSRLIKVKRSMRYLLERIQGDRAGLVLYAGSAHLHSPLTTDLNYIQELVDEATPLSVTNQGTNIGAALEVAVRALDRGAEQLQRESESVPKSRIILLVTDGEDHENQISDGVEQLKEADLKLYVLGVGTEKGGPIPIRDSTGQNFGFKRTKKGETVVSKADFTALKRLADESAGSYWTLGDSDLEVDDLIADLDSLSRGEFDERRIAIKEERFQIFVFLGILFFLIEMSFSSRKKMNLGKTTPALLLVVSLLTPVAQADSAPTLRAYRENEAAIRAFKDDKVAEAKRAFGKAQVEDPQSPDLSFNQGVVQLREGHMDDAIQGFRRAQKLAEEKGEFGLSARALYNEGVAHTAKKDYEAAATAYLKALESNRKSPDADLDGRIRKNLELLTQQQQKDQNQDQNKNQGENQEENKDQKQDQGDSNKSGKNSNSEDGEKQDEKKDPKDQGEDEQKKDAKESQGKKKEKREFKSQQLSSEDAERVMAELSRREKELKAKMERQKGRPQSLEKDW